MFEESCRVREGQYRARTPIRGWKYGGKEKKHFIIFVKNVRLSGGWGSVVQNKNK